MTSRENCGLLKRRDKMKNALVVFVISLGLLGSAFAEQCKAITQKGTRCKRNAMASNEYCWQHKKKDGASDSESHDNQNRKQRANPFKQLSRDDSVPTYERKPCQAILPDSSKCSRDANPGEKYCFRHTGCDAKVKVMGDEDLVKNTRARMNDLDDAIRRYIKSTNGPPPSNLRDLRAQMGASVSHIKDAWGTPFYYETDGVGYAIASNGPDKKPETDDDLEMINSRTEEKGNKK